MLAAATRSLATRRTFGLALAVVLGSAPVAPAGPGFPTGHVQEYRVRSRHQGRERHVWVYTPPGDAASNDSSLGMILAFDAREYRNEIPMPHILDSLIAAGAIPPLVGV